MISNKPLPAGWSEAPLPQVAQVNPAHPIEAPDDDTLVSFVPMASVEPLSGRLDASNHRPWREVKKGYTRFQEGDVLFAKITPCMENGKAALARGLSSSVGAGSTEFHVLRASLAVRPELLVHYVLQEDFRKLARAQMTGTAGQLRVPSRFLDEHTIPVPPIPEQRRIVEAIESYFTRLDDSVATLERVQRNLKRYRASVLKAAIEGRLVPTEAELARAEGRDYEPASALLDRILAERRRRWEEAELAKMKTKGKSPRDDRWKSKYIEPDAPNSTGLPSLPEGWCWASVDQLIENHDRDRVPVKRADRAKRRGRYPYYGASGQIDTIDEYLFDGSYLLVGEDGANLLARSTPIAFQVHGQFWVNNHAHVLCTYLDLPLGYMEVYLNATDLGRYVTGTAQPKLPQAAMNRIPVPLCPEPEQFRIVEEVERHLSIADDVTSALDATGSRCRSLRQSILKWAFEGRLADQDPTDEPAARLLERIQSERESANAPPRRSPRRPRARSTQS